MPDPDIDSSGMDLGIADPGTGPDLRTNPIGRTRILALASLLQLLDLVGELGDPRGEA